MDIGAWLYLDLVISLHLWLTNGSKVYWPLLQTGSFLIITKCIYRNNTCEVCFPWDLFTLVHYRYLFLFFAGSALVHLPKFAFTRIVGNSYDPTYSCNVEFPTKGGETVYFTFTFLATYVIPLVIILYCYAQILVTVWRKTSAGTESAQAQSRALRRKRKITRMVFIVVILFALCWLPNQSFSSMYTFDTQVFTYIFCKYTQTIFILSLTFKVIAHSNSIVNPFVYAFTTTSFKKHYKRVFQVCCPSSSPETPSVSVTKTKTERLTSTKEDSSM